MQTQTKLANGQYWMTFELGGKSNKRRVVVYDYRGVQYMKWADDNSEPYRAVNRAYLGLRVDQLPESTLFEPREIEVTDEAGQVSRVRVLDRDGKALRVGNYELYQRGVLSPVIVSVSEDETTGDLIATFYRGDGEQDRLRADGIPPNPDFVWVRITK